MTYYDSEIQAQDDLDTRGRDLEVLNALEKWVADLRSGDFVQGRGQLVKDSRFGDPEEFCCVGVLADNFPGVTRALNEPDVGDSFTRIKLNDSWSTVPGTVANFFEYRGFRIDWHNLYQWNDTDEASFDRIADEIEILYITPLRQKLGL